MGVSEALCLRDPGGNGVELLGTDPPRSSGRGPPRVGWRVPISRRSICSLSATGAASAAEASRLALGSTAMNDDERERDAPLLRRPS